jgi:pimeloyl-ACP methyl ester carboxylesterase
MVREAPQAEVAVIAHAGHDVPGDNPGDFDAAVLDFLRR